VADATNVSGDIPIILFSVGEVIVTPPARAELMVAMNLDLTSDALTPYLRRHVAGDWGELESPEVIANDEALERGYAVRSRYTLPTGTTLRITTSADRTHTEVFLRSPEETGVGLFQLGGLYATPGAIAALEAAGETAATYLGRHALGDWGDMDPEDLLENERSLGRGSRLFSGYNLPTGDRLWIITEADRSATTVLLPAEY